jgi:hypothetical protein
MPAAGGGDPAHVRPGQLASVVTQKCHQMVFEAHAFLSRGPGGKQAVMHATADGMPTAGAVLIAFALVAYPLWTACAGRPYPETPIFRLPCPTTIFTIGPLCFAAPPTPRSPLMVPWLWCLVGAQAALFLGVKPDLGLIVAGVAAVVLLMTAGPLRPSREVVGLN